MVVMADSFQTSRSAPSPGQPDLVLFAGIQTDDEASLDALVQRYWTPLVWYAAEIVGSRDAGEDLVQEALIRVWQNRRRLRLQGSVRAYLYKVVRNLCLNE